MPQLRNWLWKVVVTASPRVHGLNLGKPKSLGELRRADEIFNENPTARHPLSRQLFDLIGFAFAQNSLARYRHRAQKPLAAAA